MPWMTELHGTDGLGFGQRPLHQITIPGTHDAGCYVDHAFGNMLSRTQTQDVGHQLAGGIRYFDLRPYQASYVGGREFWTFHGPYTGGRLDGPAGILAQVANFLGALQPTDRELVILNLSHFGWAMAFSDADHQALIDALQQILGDHLVPHTQAALNLFDAPYDTILTDANGVTASRVAVLYDGALDQRREAYVTANMANLPAGLFVLSPKYTPAANPIYLFDQYANTNDLAALQADQIAKLNNRANYPYSGVNEAWAQQAGNWTPNAAGGVNGTLHLFSWTLTPQPYSDPLTAANARSNPALPRVFSVGDRVVRADGRVSACAGQAWTAWNYAPGTDNQINILYVDHYASHRYVNLGSPFTGLAMPVAFAAQLNVGPVRPMTW